MFSFLQVEVGLSEREIWRLTARKMFQLIDRANERIKREDYRAGIITRIVRQACGDSHAHPFDDFAHHKTETRKTKAPSAADVRRNMRAFIEQQKKLEESKGR